MAQGIVITRNEAIIEVRLDRPKANAIDLAASHALNDTFKAFRDDKDLRVCIVTGTGEKFFSAGWDLKAAAGGEASDSDWGEGGFAGLNHPRNLNKPVIAAINGPAIGIGVTMILPMDIRIAADSARFGLPFSRRGIVPESCATWFLPRVVGIANAVDWGVTGRIFPASEALGAGLVRELVPAADVLDRAMQVAAEIATTTSAVSVALTRQMMWRQLGSPHPISANRLESKALLALGGMDDAREGVSAFREKRPAEFPLTVRDLPAFVPWWDEENFDDVGVEPATDGGDPR